MPQLPIDPEDPSFVHPYREALAALRRAGRDAHLLERLSETVSLLEITSTLGSGLASQEALDATLLIVTRTLRVARAALFVRSEEGSLVLRASRGLPAGTVSTLGFLATPLAAAAPLEVKELAALGAGEDVGLATGAARACAPDEHYGLVLLVPIRRRERTIAVLGLGPREDERPYGPEETSFLQGVAACAAAPLETSLVYDELRRAHQKLSAKAFELHNLFDISRELTGTSAEGAILRLIATSAMGHFVVSRCGFYLSGPRGLSLAHGRGLRSEAESEPIALEDALRALPALGGAKLVSELPEGPLRRRLADHRLALAAPLSAGERLEGMLAIGERASGTPFSDEDREMAEALARQAVAALENARLQRVREDKLRQDRELQVAREIQQGLFPSRAPEAPGFEVAAESRPCHAVGGDAYDWISLPGGRIALVVADVAGKGTPASLLMASVHASVHALAGTAPAAEVIGRLNRFLFEKTQAGRFVTLFYAELDVASRRLSYVNAGHVPPHRVARDGTPSRLLEGGPALGLLDAASYEAGEVVLGRGDVVAIVTDGVTEATSTDDHEFGDDRVREALRQLSAGSAAAVCAGLVGAVDEWVGAAGCHDDLTALILKAR